LDTMTPRDTQAKLRRILDNLRQDENPSRAKLAGQLRDLANDLADPWMTQEDVRNVCPSCAERMASLGVRKVRASIVYGKTAEKWKSLPKGWTKDSLEKWWESLTGEVKHKVTKCIKEMEGKVDDPGAFCAAAADRIEGTTKWRGRD